MPSVHHARLHVCGEHEFTYINKDEQILEELTVIKSMPIKLMSGMGKQLGQLKRLGHACVFLLSHTH